MRRLEVIPGEDSLQALILALEFTRRVLPAEAARLGAHLQWLGEREDLVFANTFMAGMLERNLGNCITGLAEAVGALEDGAGRRRARRLAQRLRALILSGGHTDDFRLVRQPSRIDDASQDTREREIDGDAADQPES